MIIPIDSPELMKAVCWVFGRLPTEFAFGNCVAWLEVSATPTPLAVTARRGMNARSEPSGWLLYYKRGSSSIACSNELTELLRQTLDQFNTNPCYITVHYATTTT